MEDILAKKPLKVKVKRLSDEAKLPRYATDGSGAFDLVATSRHIEGYTATYGTDLAFEIPDGHVMLLFSRSGHGFNRALRLANCVPVIDSDFRGEVEVKMQYDGERAVDWPYIGDRVAQGIILPIPAVEFEETEELSETKRGAGGFGSSGA